MTVSVSFEAPQAQLDNGSTGVQLAQVILSYSIRNSEDPTKYLGGQMTLFPSDGIKLSDNTKDWERLGLAKIKEMVADAEIYAPDQIIDVTEGLPASSAVDTPVSSTADSVAGSVAEAPASSAQEAPVSSAENSEATVASSASTQETTTPSESTTEA